MVSLFGSRWNTWSRNRGFARGAWWRTPAVHRWSTPSPRAEGERALPPHFDGNRPSPRRAPASGSRGKLIKPTDDCGRWPVGQTGATRWPAQPLLPRSRMRPGRPNERTPRETAGSPGAGTAAADKISTVGVGKRLSRFISVAPGAFPMSLYSCSTQTLTEAGSLSPSDQTKASLQT